MPQTGEIKTNPNNPNQRAQWDGSQWREISAGGEMGGLKAAPAEWGPGAFVLPNGEVRRRGPRGGFEKLGEITGAAGADASPDIKEFQANAAARATLMDQGQTDYDRAVRMGYNVDNPINAFARGLEDVPMVGKYAADVLRSEPAEIARSAELQFVDGALRTTSGANAPEPEVVRANRAYFRQPGESSATEQGKGQLRDRFRDQAVRTAGVAYIPPTPARRDPTPYLLPQGASRGQTNGRARPGGNRKARAAQPASGGWKIIGVEE